MNDDFLLYVKKLNNRMIKQLQAEAYKGVNRMVAIIREYGREFDNHYKDNPEIKQGGFVKLTKKRLLELKSNDNIKAALRYL